MEILELDFKDEGYTEGLLTHLGGKLFHLTTVDAFSSIQKDKCIKNNKSGEFQVNSNSENSLGRNKGWVCLFDFRNVSEEEISKTNDCYTLHGPSWFWKYTPENRTLNLAYIFLSQEADQNLIPNEKAYEIQKQTGENIYVIPTTECWYPDHVPFDLIEKVLILKVTQSAPKSNPYLYDMHLSQC